MSGIQKFRKLFDPIDLTKGKIVKVLVAFLVPIVLSMLFQQLYTLSDSIICGQFLNDKEVSGIVDSATLVFIVLDFAIGCTNGFSVIISDKIGAKDHKMVKKSFFTQVVLCLIIASLLTLVGILSIDPLLASLHIEPSATDPLKQGIYESAKTYLFIIYLGTIPLMFYNQIVSVLRALGDSFTPFLFLVFSTILNICLDLLFIVVFHLGVAGTAWATVISQGLAAIGCFTYALIRYETLRIKKEDTKVTFSFVFKHLRLGVPLGFQFSILSVGIILMQAAVISFDIDPSGSYIASIPAQMGYGAAGRVLSFLMTPLIALGSGILTFTGQNYGAKNYSRIISGFKTALGIGLVLYIFLMTVGLLLTINGFYQHIFLSSDKISEASIRYGNTYLYVSMPFFGFLMALFVSRNAMQGLEKPLWPFIAGVAELIARSTICIFLPVLVNKGPTNSESGILPYIMVCLADPVAWIIACALMLVPFILTIKKEKKLEMSLLSKDKNNEILANKN